MTAMTEQSSELLALRQLADDIFAASAEPVLDAQERRVAYDPALWNTLTGSGLTLLTTPESLGGSGAGLHELGVVLESAGYHSAAVPLVEHDLLAAWLLRTAELPIPEGPMTAAVTTQPLQSGRLVAVFDLVSWADAADVLVVASDGFVAALSREQFSVEESTDIAGQPIGRVSVDATLKSGRYRSVDVDLREYRLRGALGRAVQTCGALARALELSREHVQQREQFGRPIAKFQAVQTLISSAAGALAVAKTAAEFAIEIATLQGFSSPHAMFAISVAKIESARAATIVARNAHQAHGAIGFTLDHRLRHFTLRALAWRSEFGTQRQWQHDLGQMALASTSSVWELVTELSSAPLSIEHK